MPLGEPLRVLVSRTDRIGDVALTLPLCGLLKSRLGAHVTFLGTRYTHDVPAACEGVDAVLDWDATLGPDAARDLLASARADAIVHVKPNVDVARAARRARIRLRIGTSRRLFHWWTCNRLEPLGRRASPLHEAQLDVALARHLLGFGEDVPSVASLAPFGALTPRVPVPDALRPLVARDRFTLVVHPRSGGSAAEWPLAQWRALFDALPADRFRVLVTGTAAERASLGTWMHALPAHVYDVTGRTTVAELIALVAAADGFIAASTGPLHVAAATGVHTLGLFSPRRPIHPGRWAPIGARAEVLVGSSGASPTDDVASITVDDVAARVRAWAGA